MVGDEFEEAVLKMAGLWNLAFGEVAAEEEVVEAVVVTDVCGVAVFGPGPVKKVVREGNDFTD